MKLLILTTYDYPYSYHVYILDTNTGGATRLEEFEELRIAGQYMDSRWNEEEQEDVRKRYLVKYGCDTFLFFENGSLDCVERKKV